MNALNLLIIILTTFTFGCGEADFTKFSRLQAAPEWLALRLAFLKSTVLIQGM